MSIYLCEGSGCEEHCIEGEDEEYELLDSLMAGCCIVAKTCPDISIFRGDGFEVVQETEHAILFRRVERFT